MGYSRPYAIFCGLVETVGGLLLFWQRTTTLGALIVAASMANVAMLNFSYDVPVKLFLDSPVPCSRYSCSCRISGVWRACSC